MIAPPLEWLLEAVTAKADATAVQFRDAGWSYAELTDRSLRTASILASHGVGPGSRVAIVLGMGPHYVTGLLGAMALGATVVPINPLYRRSELVFHLGNAAIAAVVTEPSHAPLCVEARMRAERRGPVLSFGSSDVATDISRLVESARPASPVAVRASDTAIVLHTAGSTGRSKLVPRTHAQLRAECDSTAATSRASPDDVIFGMLPLYHCHGLFNCLFAALRARCRLYLFTDPRPLVLVRNAVMESMVRESATILPSIPFQLEQLMLAQGDFDLSSLRLCYSGGAPLKEETYKGFRERFGLAVRQQYGCTEAGAVTLNLSDDIDETWMSAGTALAGNAMAIFDADASGEGEIFVSSPALTSGYEGMDELNREVFVNGGFRTGDLGRMDEAGRLLVTRRRPIYVDVAGHKVDSREVEDVLEDFPGVRAAIVVAMNGQPAAMKAVVVSSSKSDRAELRRFCRDRLASYKVPSVFEFREAIPRDSMGKLLRKDLM